MTAAHPNGERIAIVDAARPWTATRLARATLQAALALERADSRVVATVMDNGAAFLALDDAVVSTGRVHVPLPTFFTPAQRAHALAAAAVDTLVVSPAVAAAWPALPWAPLDLDGVALHMASGLRPVGGLDPRALPGAPAGTSRVTFTSGSTGDPKGVCLSTAALDDVAQGVVQALAPLGVQRHLSVLPLSVLLEHVAGAMAARRHGATVMLPPLVSLGWQGSSTLDITTFDARVRELAPDTIILLPQMLRLWCDALAQWKRPAPPSLRFVAVGGAAVGATLVEKAASLGLPVGEGYGLSECGSVQTLNLPGASRAGSVGRPLPHTRLRVADDGEIWVSGTRFLGYLGQDTNGPAHPATEWPTGDLGRIDDDGFVHLHGRKSQRLITAYGRNVSPEWIEGALQQHDAVAQAVVLGDGQPALSAVLWPARGADAVALAAAVQATNQQLPDYARVARWVVGAAAFDASTGLATPNGRPRRRAALDRHASLLGLPAAHDAPLLQASCPERRLNPMSFHTRLLRDTEEARQGLLSAPIIVGALSGRVSLPSYIAFLTEAYHHVRHTVPLLRATRAALRPDQEWLVAPLTEYVEEESGHDEWILQDIAACGADAEAVRHGRPGHATEVMVAYAYDTIARGNPLGFFGMVHVLEGTSVALALQGADAIQRPLGLPDQAFRYLRSHGTLDQEHTAHFATLMDAVDDPNDQAHIVHAARAFYRLYGDVFRSLPLPSAPAAPARAGTPLPSQLQVTVQATEVTEVAP